MTKQFPSREDWTKALSLVEPGLHQADLLPILNHFCFTEDEVYAYNDRIAIRAPFRSGLNCAVPGRLLLSLLSASRADAVEVSLPEQDGGGLKLKLGRFTATLPTLGPDSFIFEWPKKKALIEIELTKSLLSAIEYVMQTVGENLARPETLGVLMRPRIKSAGKVTGLLLNSTNGRVVSDVSVKLANLDWPEEIERAQLSDDFCAAVLKLSADDRTATLKIGKRHCLAEFSDGCVVFGRLIEVEEPLDYDRMINHHTKGLGEERSGMVPIPGETLDALRRCALLGEACQMIADAGVLTITSDVAGGKGESAETLRMTRQMGSASGKIGVADALIALTGASTFYIAKSIMMVGFEPVSGVTKFRIASMSKVKVKPDSAEEE